MSLRLFVCWAGKHENIFVLRPFNVFFFCFFFLHSVSGAVKAGRNVQWTPRDSFIVVRGAVSSGIFSSSFCVHTPIIKRKQRPNHEITNVPYPSWAVTLLNRNLFKNNDKKLDQAYHITTSVVLNYVN